MLDLVCIFRHFKRYSSILLEFIPQMVFLCALFLWMVVMMLLKWTLYSPAPGKPIKLIIHTEVHFLFSETEQEYTPGCAPSVLILFINMMLFKSQEPLEGCKEHIFDFQPILQYILVALALGSIPVMLFGKPLYIRHKRKQLQALSINGNANGHVNGVEQVEPYGNHEEEEEDFGELMIHQAIHTVEYVLSTVSHTASYLRLWALSLAHARKSFYKCCIFSIF